MIEKPAVRLEDAVQLAKRFDKIPIGVFYNISKPIYHQELYGEWNPVVNRLPHANAFEVLHCTSPIVYRNEEVVIKYDSENRSRRMYECGACEQTCSALFVVESGRKASIVEKYRKNTPDIVKFRILSLVA